MRRVRMRALVGIMMLCACGIVAAQSPRAGLRIVVIDGDEAANIVAEKIAAEPVIEVRDREDRRVPGAVVRFAMKRTLRNRLPAVFRDGRSEVRTLTDASGRARATAVTPLEPGSYEIDVEASYQSQTATATVRQTNYATAADARAEGRQPVQSSGATARVAGVAESGVTAGTLAGGAGGMSHGLLVGLAAAGGGAGAAVAFSQRRAAERPTASVTGIDSTAIVGIQSATPFTFTALTTGFDTGTLSYRWEFGDGTTSTEATPTHQYAVAGPYTVAITVSDARQSSRSERNITVISLTGTWKYILTSAVGTPEYTLQLTQSGANITGLEAHSGYSNCVVSGTAALRPAVVLTVEACPHPEFAPFTPHDYSLELSADGQTLVGTMRSHASGTIWSGLVLRR